jgi:hypothetical protein
MALTLSDLRVTNRRSPLPTTILWRWRYEAVTLAATLLGAFVTVSKGIVGQVVPIVILTLSAGFSWSTTRQLAIRAFWHVVTPHRLRKAFKEGGVYSRNGTLPSVILTHSTWMNGERVWIWCVAGTSPEELAIIRPILRATAWAEDVHVTRHAHFSHIAILDVVRERGPDV